MPNVLVIDVGNTSTSIGLYRNGRIQRVRRLRTADTSPRICAACLQASAAGVRVDGVAVASVVPRVTPLWHRAGAAWGRTLVVDRHAQLGVPVDYPRPETIGADRLANACGGVRKYGAPLIVADFGTAVTFDCITAGRGYIGGIIAPGLPLMFDYLAEKTALLPHIAPGRARHGVGRSTREAMQLGAQWGYRGMVREILQQLRRSPDLRRATLVATGGYAKWVVDGLRPAMIVDQGLTLYGLGSAFEMNS